MITNNSIKKQATEQLWRTSFGDTEEFIRLYFDHVYRDENTLTIEKDGRIVSALQILPYTMMWGNTEIPIAYICGVCTHPSEQKKGYMNLLMEKAHSELKRRRIPLATLIPAQTWLFDIYKKQGYEEAFYYSTENYFISGQTNTSGNMTVSAATELSDDLYPYFNRKLRERPRCILHSQADFSIIWKDLMLYRGVLFVARDESKTVTGIAFALPADKQGTSIKINELLYDNSEVKEQLLSAVAHSFHAPKIHYHTPPRLHPTPRGMAKIIDPNLLIDFSGKDAYMSLMLD